MEKPGRALSAAVREHLRQLCLREFPCGTGSWNKSRFLPRTPRAWRELVPRDEEVVSPGEESVEALLDLVRSPHSPWALLEGSSAEDRFLKELAIQNPLVLKDTFFYSYFRSLRVVDKQVNLVDKGLLKFLKLEELVLSANQIKEVDAINLPPTLKVLELYGNKITSMECLCAHPPPRLQHLGLGHNKLLGPLESLYVTADHWPNLVSLDLSFNDLTDLQGMIASLSTLQHLRLLVLQGNPLGLVPYYRGFTIDSLPRLCVLDDITVSPSEKYQFRGLSHHGDLLACEAQLVVTIGNVKGVPDTSILDPDPGPQGPFISYSYYVTYGFVEDEEGEGSKYGGVLAEAKPRVSSSQENGGTPAPAEIVPPNVDLSGGARRAFKTTTTAQKPPCFPPGAQAPAPARARCAEDPERRPRGARVSPADRQALGARRAAGPGRPRGALRGARRLRRVGPVLAVGGAGGLAGLGRVGGPALGDGLGGGAGGAGAAAAARGSPAPPLPGEPFSMVKNFTRTRSHFSFSVRSPIN